MAKCGNRCKETLRLNPRRLRHRIELQEEARTSDNAGGFTKAWATVATVWAEIKPMSEKERFISMQTESHATHKITIRYAAAATTAKRIKFDDRYFDITGIINKEERNIIMEITATEGTIDG